MRFTIPIFCTFFLYCGTPQDDEKSTEQSSTNEQEITDDDNSDDNVNSNDNVSSDDTAKLLKPEINNAGVYDQLYLIDLELGVGKTTFATSKDLIYLANGKTIFQSANGTDWTQHVVSSLSDNDLIMDISLNTESILIGTKSGMWLSPLSSLSFTKISLDDETCSEIDGVFHAPNFMAYSCRRRAFSYDFRYSLDSGNTWKFHNDIDFGKTITSKGNMHVRDISIFEQNLLFTYSGSGLRSIPMEEFKVTPADKIDGKTYTMEGINDQLSGMYTTTKSSIFATSSANRLYIIGNNKETWSRIPTETSHIKSIASTEEDLALLYFDSGTAGIAISKDEGLSYTTYELGKKFQNSDESGPSISNVSRKSVIFKNQFYFVGGGSQLVRVPLP